MEKADAVEREIPAQQWTTIGSSRGQRSAKPRSASTWRRRPELGERRDHIVEPEKKVVLLKDRVGALDWGTFRDDGQHMAGAGFLHRLMERCETANMKHLCRSLSSRLQRF